MGGGLRGRNHFGHWMVTLNYSTGYAHGGKTFTEFITEMGGSPSSFRELHETWLFLKNLSFEYFPSRGEGGGVSNHLGNIM